MRVRAQSDDLRYLDEAERAAWELDLGLREAAKDDPYLAALLADADAKYEATYGRPWVNPLIR